MSAPEPCPAGLMERFGAFILRLKQAMAEGSGRNKALMGPITILLWRYLSRSFARLAAIHAKFVAGTLAPPRPRPATRPRAEVQAREHPETQRAAAKKPAGPSPRGRIPPGPVFVPYFVAHLHHALNELIADPEMVALLEASPQAGRILRGLWRRVNPRPLPPVLRLPKRPRRRSETSPPQSEPPSETTPSIARAAPLDLRPPTPPPAKSPDKPPRPRPSFAPARESGVWVWHLPPLKRV